MCVTISQKNKSILRQILQCFQVLPLAGNHCVPLQKIYLDRAERTFPPSVSILKSFANGNFLKLVIDMVFFLPQIYFLLGVGGKERITLSPSQVLYNKLDKYLSLSIYENIYLIHKVSFFSMKNNCSIICKGEQLLIHLVSLTIKTKLHDMT